MFFKFGYGLASSALFRFDVKHQVNQESKSYRYLTE